MASTQSTRSLLSSALATGTALTFAIGAALVTSVISAAPASAHATFVKITPAASAQLTSAPKEVVVEFDEPVNTTFATVVVTNSAGVSVAQGQPVVLGAKVTQALSSELASGDFRIAFQVTSNDGHPVTGQSRFTLALAPGVAPKTPPGSPSATPSGQVEATPNGALGGTPNGPVAGTLSADPQDSFLTRFLVPIAGAVGLLVLGAGLLLWERQRR